MALIVSAGLPSVARADLVLSQVIVDLAPGKPAREDIEVWNDGAERIYVGAEPFEILGSGTPHEQRVPVEAGKDTGLLVSPQRMLLEPGERRIIRIAAIAARPESERTFRVAIKPVVGELVSDQSGVKVLIGYDALVLVRPQQQVDDLRAERSGRLLILRNEGNTSQEIFAGSQCANDGDDCRALPAKRLYPGAMWSQTLPFETKVDYKSAIGSTVRKRVF